MLNDDLCQNLNKRKFIILDKLSYTFFILTLMLLIASVIISILLKNKIYKSYELIRKQQKNINKMVQEKKALSNNAESKEEKNYDF